MNHAGERVPDERAGTIEKARVRAMQSLRQRVRERNEAHERLADAERAMTDAIRTARAVGIGWSEIADPVGLTRQAIAKRLGQSQDG